MFGITRTASISKLRQGIINTQETMIQFKLTVTDQSERVAFFNETLEEHEENWTSTLKNMRRVWSEMKKDFQATRRSVAAIGNRVKRIEGWIDAEGNFADAVYEKREEDSKDMLKTINQMEKQLAKLEEKHNALTNQVNLPRMKDIAKAGQELSDHIRRTRYEKSRLEDVQFPHDSDFDRDTLKGYKSGHPNY